jgi:cadmium resistance protein CadD (predicted permease)
VRSTSALNLLLLLAADIVAFSVTNIDDIFVLLGFLSLPTSLPRHVVMGQYLGIGAIVGSSLALSLVSLVIPLAWVGLIGVLPIAIGLRIAFKSIQHIQSGQDSHVTDSVRRTGGTVLQVAIVTTLNGADNLAVYTPLFAVQTIVERGITVVVFLVLTGLCCWIATEIVRHPILGAPIRYWGRRLLPVVLIGLGIMVLIDSGSLRLFTVWWN